jgi:hypothetical protein
MSVRDVLRAGRVFVQNIAPGARRADHRAAVGGLWDVIGPLQFDFMLQQGLRPEHCLLDIGCGSLRAGRFFIEYLDAGGYLGLDGDETLVTIGLAAEVDSSVVTAKRPQFAFNHDFEFTFERIPDFALAQSVFTHLTRKQIMCCLTNLREFAPDCRLFATFNESSFRWPNWFAPHTQRTYFYTRDELLQLARQCGWSMSYIGDWNHPRGQHMLAFARKDQAVV